MLLIKAKLVALVVRVVVFANCSVDDGGDEGEEVDEQNFRVLRALFPPRLSSVSRLSGHPASD